MNIELLQQFGQNYPEEFDGALDSISLAVTCAFNRRGTLLAVGCNDGRIVIWDFLTRGIAKLITAHVHPLCSLRYDCILLFIIKCLTFGSDQAGHEMVINLLLLPLITQFVFGMLFQVTLSRNGVLRHQ